MSLKINSKSRILVKGESGSGKSTLIRILSGSFRPTTGRIFLNDTAVNNLKLNSYRARLGLVLSDETPFEGSIKENLTLGDESITQ